MKHLFEARHKIVNREMRRAAIKEAERYFDRFNDAEYEFYELLFESEYAYRVLERWINRTVNFHSRTMRQDIKVVHLIPKEITFGHLKSEETELKCKFTHRIIKANNVVRQLITK